MELSVKFTSQKIYIAEQSIRGSKVKVHRTFEADMPEGAYQAGVIIDTITVADRIRELLKTNNILTKKAVAVIHGLDIIQKELNLPPASAGQTRGLVENELKKTDILNTEYLFDYTSDTYSKDKEETAIRQVPTFLIPRTLVQNYIQTLQKAGLKPIRLKPFLDTMDKLIKAMRLNTKEDLTILVYVESGAAEVCMTGNGIKNVYRSVRLEDEEHIEENMYILSARQGVQKSRNPEQVMLENLTESISKLVQFQLQRDRSMRIGQILVYGEFAQSEDFITALGEGTSISTSRCILPDTVLKQGAGRTEALYNLDMVAAHLSKAVGEKKELGFVFQYNEQKAGYTTFRDKIVIYMMAAILMIVTVGGGVAAALNYRNQKILREYEYQIEQIITSAQYNENLVKEGLLESYIVYNRICTQYIDVLKNKSRLESSLMKQLDALKGGQVDIYSYSFDKDTLILGVKTADQNAPAVYAEKVTTCGLFSSVEYTGFEEDIDIEGKAYYQFSLKCILK